MQPDPIMEFDIDDLAKVQENLRRVPMGEVRMQHRKRYLVRTSAYDIILKRILEDDIERIIFGTLNDMPEYLELSKRYIHLKKMAAGLGLTSNEMEELNALEEKMLPVGRQLEMACFVDPKLESEEDYDALRNALSFADRQELGKVLEDLTNPSVGAAVSKGLAVAHKYGIPLPEDLTLENMTAQQADALMKSAGR